MRLRFGTILAAGCAIGEAAFLSLPAAARADETPLAESAAITYAADTRPSPRAVKTAAELAELVNGTWAVTRRDGETVTLTSPSGISSALAGSALNLDAGGVWTVANSRQRVVPMAIMRLTGGTRVENAEPRLTWKEKSYNIRSTAHERTKSMTTRKTLNGKPYAGNPHVRFDENMQNVGDSLAPPRSLTQ